MRNDVSFLIANQMNLYEQQSTYNPNMPIRFLIYAGMIYADYIENSDDFNPYSTRQQKAPTPKCICFYNGHPYQEDRTILNLQDAFEGDSDIDVRVTMLNINYGQNKQLMDACKPLREYAWFIDRILTEREKGLEMEDAIDIALNEMTEDFVIRPFLLSNRAEVKLMCITEYNEAKTLALFRAEERAEGRAEGRKEGRAEGHIDVALKLLKEHLPLSLIAGACNLSEEQVRQLADTNGIALA